MKSYKIEYELYLKGGKQKHMRATVRDCYSELHAKMKLDSEMKLKFADFESICIYKTEVVPDRWDLTGDDAVDRLMNIFKMKK